MHPPWGTSRSRDWSWYGPPTLSPDNRPGPSFSTAPPVAWSVPKMAHGSPAARSSLPANTAAAARSDASLRSRGAGFPPTKSPAGWKGSLPFGRSQSADAAQIPDTDSINRYPLLPVWPCVSAPAKGAPAPFPAVRAQSIPSLCPPGSDTSSDILPSPALRKFPILAFCLQFYHMSIYTILFFQILG